MRMLFLVFVAVCCHVMVVLVSLLTPLRMNCLKDVGNDPDCRSNINRETCVLKRSVILKILSYLKSGSVWPL